MQANYLGLDKILGKKELEKMFLRELSPEDRKRPSTRKRVRQIAGYIHTAYQIGLKAGTQGAEKEPHPDLVKDMNVQNPSADLEQICGYVYQMYDVGYETGVCLRMGGIK